MLVVILRLTICDSKRVDPVVADLVTVIEESTRGTPTDDDLEIAEAMIKALEGQCVTTPTYDD